MIIVVAVYSDWGIGFEGSQQIVLPEDRAYFNDFTSGGTVIVGRKTFEALRGPLPRRKNIVLTRNLGYDANGAIVRHTVDEVLAEIGDTDPEKVFLIGGAEIYLLFMPYCSYASVTKIEASPMSDVFFPNLDALDNWVLAKNFGTHRSKNGIECSYCLYEPKFPH